MAMASGIEWVTWMNSTSKGPNRSPISWNAGQYPESPVGDVSFSYTSVSYSEVV